VSEFECKVCVTLQNTFEDGRCTSLDVVCVVIRYHLVIVVENRITDLEILAGRVLAPRHVLCLFLIQDFEVSIINLGVALLLDEVEKGLLAFFC
jgi:hypothetical protein